MFHHFDEKTQDSVVCPIAATRYRGTVAPLPSMQQAARCSAGADSWRARGVRHAWALSDWLEGTSRAQPGKHAFRTSKPTMDSQAHGGRSSFVHLGADEPRAVPSARGRGVLDCILGNIPGLRSNQPSRLNGQAVSQPGRACRIGPPRPVWPLGSRIIRNPPPASTPERAACRLPSRRTTPRNWPLSTRSSSEAERAGCPRRDEQRTLHPSGFSVARAGCPRSRHARSGSPEGMPGDQLSRSANSDAERTNWVLLRASTPAPTRTDHGMDDRRDFNGFNELPSLTGVDTQNAASRHEHALPDAVARMCIRQALPRRAPLLHSALKRCR